MLSDLNVLLLFDFDIDVNWLWIVCFVLVKLVMGSVYIIVIDGVVYIVDKCV